MARSVWGAQICLQAVLALAVVGAALPCHAQQTLCNSGVCVLTWQQDTGTDIGAGYSYRTGQNLSESTITASAIASQGFGVKCSAALDGQIYAQPLIVTHVNWQNQVPAVYHDIAYVVTQNDTVYAIDATNCTILNFGGTSLLKNNFQNQPIMSAVDCHYIGARTGNCPVINPTVGVLGTPVIDLNSTNTAGTLYVVRDQQLRQRDAVTVRKENRSVLAALL